MSTKQEKRRRAKEEIQFFELCKKGNVESVKTLLAKDPSLINSKDILQRYYNKDGIGKLLNLV